MSERELKVKNEDVELAVRVVGDPTKPAIVLVHGYPDNRSVWDGVAGRLAARYCVITYDVRGAGASTSPAERGGFGVAHLASDLIAVIDATVGAKPVHLVGHDWGSIQAWHAVTEPRLQSRFLSYTTISGPCLDHVGHWLRHQPARTLLAQQAKSWYIAAFQLPGAKLAWRAFGKHWPALLSKREGIRAATGDHARDGERGIDLYRENMAERIGKPERRTTELPVQLIVPTRDAYVGRDVADACRPFVRDLTRREVVAGHWLPISHPELLARWISEYVDGIGHTARPFGSAAGRGQAATVEARDSRREAPAVRRGRARDPKRALSGTLAIVTGAGGGIGRATAFELVERGAEVIAADLDLVAAKRTAELGELLGGRVYAERVDVSDRAAMTELAARVRRDHGAPDIVVNNAGIAVAGSFFATTAAEWDRVLDTNLGGVVLGCRLFAQQMLDEGRPGHVINIASAAAFAPSRAMSAYSTSKAAVVMLTECLRAELASSGIRVGVVCPGFVDTGITSATRFAGEDSEREAKRRRRTARMYRARGLTADHVARAIARAIEHDEPLTLIGAEAIGVRALSRFAPGLSRRLAQVDLAASPSGDAAPRGQAAPRDLAGSPSGDAAPRGQAAPRDLAGSPSGDAAPRGQAAPRDLAGGGA